MIPAVFCYDVRADIIPGENGFAKGMGGKVILSNGGWSIPAIIGKVLGHLKRGNSFEKLESLYLVAHGSPGELQIGTGLDVNTAEYFRPLKGKFEGLKTIYIHGCNVASNQPANIKCGCYVDGQGTWGGDGAGYQLMKKLASETGAFVKAAIHTQYADHRLEYEGPTVIVSPSGKEIWPWSKDWR